jgi:hypothetical protein
MTKTVFVILIVLCCSDGYAQNGFIVLKKGQKSIQHFWKDSHFTFQLQNKQWLTGIITKITPDSFYLTQEIIRYYLMGSDTLHFSGFAFTLNDVYALPTKKELINYEHDQVKVILGHEKLAWVRNGFIFQVTGAGYVALNVANDLIHGIPPFAKDKLAGLGIGAVIFLLGEVLHLIFDPYWRIGKKYHLECVVIEKTIK